MSLSDTKKLFEDKANLIDNWRELSKNDLCNMFLDCVDVDKKEGYFSAIVCKYWPSLSRMIQKSKNSFSDVDCYDAFIDSLLEAFKRVDWRNSSKEIYEDENGPDKIINKIMSCRYANMYTYSNYKKRSANYSSIHIEQLIEDADTHLLPSIKSEYQEYEIDDYIIENFKNKDYFSAFVVDIIINNVRDSNKDDSISYHNWVVKNIARQLMSNKDLYIVHFANSYEFDVHNVEKAFSYVDRLTPKRLHQKIGDTLIRLSRDKNLIKLLT